MLNLKIIKDSSVLIVDDEVFIANQMAEMVRPLFKNSYVCYNGYEALEIIQNNKDIKVVVSDINMPKMDGLSLFAHLRKNFKNIALIVTSAHSEQKYYEKAIELRIDGFITKPVIVKDLISMITKAIARYNLQEMSELSNSSLVENYKLLRKELENKEYFIEKEKYINKSNNWYIDRFMLYCEIDEHFNIKKMSSYFKEHFDLSNEDSIVHISGDNEQSMKIFLLVNEAIHQAMPKTADITISSLLGDFKGKVTISPIYQNKTRNINGFGVVIVPQISIIKDYYYVK